MKRLRLCAVALASPALLLLAMASAPHAVYLPFTARAPTESPAPADTLVPTATPTSTPSATPTVPETPGPTPTDSPGLTGDVRGVHDPSIIKHGDTYYVFSTGSATERIPIRCSKDLQQWRLCGDVFSTFPDWTLRAVPGVTSLWAPDISLFNGKYHLYYSVSTFGSNRSAIGLATNRTLDLSSPDYLWQDEGMVIQSWNQDDWNAIDPNLILDESGQPWLAFGSFWSGIKLRRVDLLTGKLSTDDTRLYSLASRPRGPDLPGAIEAPFIVRRGSLYYLFVSFDMCCQGIDSTYRVMVGRSSKVIGPYSDRASVPMALGGGTLVLAGAGRWRGPGHNAVLQEAGGDRIIYHAYDAEDGGAPKLRIASLAWDAEGWPLAAMPNVEP